MNLSIPKFVPMSALAVGLIAGQSARSIAQSYAVYMEVVTKTDNQSREESAKLSLQAGSRFRVEQSSKGGSRIVIVNGLNTWAWEPSSKNGMHGKQNAKAVAKMDAQGSPGLMIFPNFVKMGGKKVSAVRIDGQMLETYEYKAKNGMVHTLSLYPGTQHLPRRLVEAGVIRAATSLGSPMESHILNRQTDFTNWKVGITLDPGIFKPPGGMTFQEAPQAAPPLVPKKK
ncbi:MAG: hypothetical protein ABJA67_09640 [Chthonomonadales bacterium]